MADLELDKGFTLPPVNEPKGLPQDKAREYSVQLATVAGGNDAASLIKVQQEIAEAGRVETQREVVRSNKAFQEGSKLIADTTVEFEKVGATIDRLNAFQELDKQIKEEAFENKVVKQFRNTDPETNQILNERMDAVQVDDLRLSNELAFNNINLEVQAQSDSFFSDLADFFEVLGPAQIDEILFSQSNTDLFVELQRDMTSLPTQEFRNKWKDKFVELQKEKHFTNVDRVIAQYAMLNRGSLSDAKVANFFRGAEAATSIGVGTALKFGKNLVSRAILNKSVSPSMVSAPVKGSSVQVNSLDTLRSKLPEGLFITEKGIKTIEPTGPLSVNPLQANPRFTREKGISLTFDPISEAVNNAIKSRSFVSDVMVRSGGSNNIAKDVAKSILIPTASKILPEVEQVGYALMGVTPTETLNSVPMLVRKALEKQDRVLADSTNLAIDAVGNTLTGQALTKKLEIEAAAEFTGGSVANVSYVYHNNGILSGITAHVGAESGSPFASRGIAEQWLKDTKLKGDIFESETGGFLVNIERSAEGISEEVVAHARNSGWFRSIMFQPSETLDPNLQLLSRASEQSQTHLHSLFSSVWNNGIKPMSAGQRVQVEEVMTAVKRRSHMEGGAVWLTPDDFISEFKQVHGTNPVQKQVLGYLTAKQLEDTSYRLLNRSVYKMKQAQGFEQVSYKGTSHNLPDDFTGKIVGIEDIKAGEIIYHEGTNLLSQYDTSVAAGISKAVLEKELQGKQLIKLSGDTPVGKDGLAQYVIVPSENIAVSPLSPKQVGYIGGGRIKYDYNWIVHARRERKYDMFGGKNVGLNPVALFGGKTRHEVTMQADRLNKARLIAKANKKGDIPLAEANSAIQALKLPKFQSVDELTNFLKSRGVELSDEISANPDGSIPTATGAKIQTESQKIRSAIQNRVAKARTHNRLEDVRGGYGIVSPFEALSRSLGIASRHASFADYRQHALTSFSNSYGKFMEVQPRAGISPMDVVQSKLSQKAKNELSVSEQVNIKSHQNQILHTLRIETPVAKAWSSAMDSMSDWFLKGKEIPLTKNRIADKLSDARSTNPVSYWKNIAFQSRLGLFSLPQFVLQASMAPSIMAMSPKHGVGAMMDILPLKMALQANDPAMVKDLAMRLGKARIWSKEEAADFVEFVDVFKNLGISDFGTALPELAGATEKGVAGTKFSSFLDKGQVFFRLGEFMPRATAAGIAARKIREKGIKLSSDEGKAEMITEVNRLTLGITGADVQIGMRGAASIPTQFWSYPTRMITALAGKELTAAEKAGMYGSFAALWGAGGIPMGNAMVDYYQTHWGAEITPDEAKLLYNGIVDTLIFNATDGEISTDLSSRQLGDFIPSVIETFTENPVMAFLGGPTGGSLADGADVLMRELGPVIAAGTGTLDQITDAALGALAANITSVDRLFRGWLAYETGVLRDRKGRASISMTNDELLLWAAGMPMQEFNDIYTQMDIVKNRVQEPSSKIALEMFNLTKRYHTDSKNADIYQQQVNALRQVAIDNGMIDLVLRNYSKLMKDTEFTEQQQLRYDKYRMLGRNVPATPSSSN